MVLLRVQLRTAAPERHHAAGRTLVAHLAHEDQEHGEDQQPGAIDQEHRGEHRVLVAPARAGVLGDVEDAALDVGAAGLEPREERAEVAHVLDLEPDRARGDGQREGRVVSFDDLARGFAIGDPGSARAGQGVDEQPVVLLGAGRGAAADHRIGRAVARALGLFATGELLRRSLLIGGDQPGQLGAVVALGHGLLEALRGDLVVLADGLELLVLGFALGQVRELDRELLGGLALEAAVDDVLALELLRGDLAGVELVLELILRELERFAQLAPDGEQDRDQDQKEEQERPEGPRAAALLVLRGLGVGHRVSIDSGALGHKGRLAAAP